MQCVILAAGEGTRMRPLTYTTPKPLVPILGTPLLERIILALPREIDEIIMVIGYMGEKVQEYFGAEWRGKRMRYIKQKEPRGTYDALFLAKPLLRDERFMVAFSDDLHSPEGFKKLVEKNELSILLYRADHPERFGVVTLNPDGTLKEVQEKPEHPKSHLVSCGPMVLTKEIFNYPPKKRANGELCLAESVHEFAQTYRVYGVVTDWWIPVGYVEDIKKAEEFLKTKVGNSSI